MHRPSRATRFATAVVALAALSTLSCGRGDRGDAGTAAGVVESSEPLWTTGEAWRVGAAITSVGALDGPPESQLYQVTDLTRLEDGSVVVASRGSGGLRVYGPDGGFIRAMGGEGEGPGEFGIPRYIVHAPPDTLITLDPRLRRAVVYLTDGSHIRTFRVSGVSPYSAPHDRLDDGRWIDFTSVAPEAPEELVTGNRRESTVAIAFGSDSTSADTLATGAGPESWYEVNDRGEVSGVLPVPFGGGYLAAASGDRVAISDGGAYDIVVVTLAGDTLRVRRTVGRQRVTAELLDEWTAYWAARWTGERRTRLLRTIDDIVHPEFVPTHTELVFDRLGNLWVENYRHPWEASPRMWSVFGRDGRWLGDVELPDDLQVYEIGADYVAGIERDEIGVEHVRVYTLEK